MTRKSFEDYRKIYDSQHGMSILSSKYVLKLVLQENRVSGSWIQADRSTWPCTLHGTPIGKARGGPTKQLY